MSDVQIFQPARLLSTHEIADLLRATSYALATGRSMIVVDLSQVTFMDSRGLAGLIAAYKRVKASGGLFSVCGARGQPQMLLELTEVKTLLAIYSNVADLRQARAKVRELAQSSLAPAGVIPDQVLQGSTAIGRMVRFGVSKCCVVQDKPAECDLVQTSGPDGPAAGSLAPAPFWQKYLGVAGKSPRHLLPFWRKYMMSPAARDSLENRRASDSGGAELKSKKSK